MGKSLAAKVEAADRWRGSTLAALQFLAFRAKRNIVRGVSLQDIADQIGLTYKRTKEIMHRLRKGGIVEIIQRGRGTRTNVYRLHLSGRSGAA